MENKPALKTSQKTDFDSMGLLIQVEKHDNLLVQVVETVGKLSGKLPKDLKELPVNSGDKAEGQVQTVINKIKDAANDSQKNRMQYTRKFDEIKKSFTTTEAAIRKELEKLEGFVIGWNAEKLRRQRLEDDKIKKQQAEKQKLVQLRHDIKSYYLTLIIKYNAEQMEQFEKSYFSKNEEQLKEWAEKFKSFNSKALRKKWMDMFEKNGYPEELEPVEQEIEAEIFKNEIVRCIDEKLNEVAMKVKELVLFVPSRIEKLKSLDENAKAEEAKKLKEKQDAERLAAEQKQKDEAEAQLTEERTAAAIESIDLEASTELTKGTSVKLKYSPNNHTELLKVINWYLLNAYKEEDFETLNKRLSFMRTAADRTLNNDGEVIDGVPTIEDIRKRRTN